MYEQVLNIKERWDAWNKFLFEGRQKQVVFHCGELLCGSNFPFIRWQAVSEIAPAIPLSQIQVLCDVSPWVKTGHSDLILARKQWKWYNVIAELSLCVCPCLCLSVPPSVKSQLCRHSPSHQWKVASAFWDLVLLILNAKSGERFHTNIQK